MLETIYGVLARLGYTHPLHPAFTHVPMGMLMGGFLFALASLKWHGLEKTAFSCYMLALLFLPLTALFGAMDWQYRYNGQWTGLIIAKISGAFTLAVLLLLLLYVHTGKRAHPVALWFLYISCFINANVLGFIGGQILYG